MHMFPAQGSGALLFCPFKVLVENLLAFIWREKSFVPPKVNELPTSFSLVNPVIPVNPPVAVPMTPLCACATLSAPLPVASGYTGASWHWVGAHAMLGYVAA
jgi:hypothetical protein